MIVQQTTIYLTVIMISLFGFMALIFSINMEKKNKEKELEMKYQQHPSKKVTKTEKNDQILFTLNFMLERNILTVQEYNKLMVKCLPHME